MYPRDGGFWWVWDLGQRLAMERGGVAVECGCRRFTIRQILPRLNQKKRKRETPPLLLSPPSWNSGEGRRKAAGGDDAPQLATGHRPLQLLRSGLLHPQRSPSTGKLPARKPTGGFKSNSTVFKNNSLGLGFFPLKKIVGLDLVNLIFLWLEH